MLRITSENLYQHLFKAVDYKTAIALSRTSKWFHNEFSSIQDKLEEFYDDKVLSTTHDGSTIIVVYHSLRATLMRYEDGELKEMVSTNKFNQPHGVRKVAGLFIYNYKNGVFEGKQDLSRYNYTWIENYKEGVKDGEFIFEDPNYRAHAMFENGKIVRFEEYGNKRSLGAQTFNKALM